MRPQRQFQLPTLREELMRQPTLRILFSIQFGALNVDVLIPSIEVDGSDSRGVARVRVPDVDFREEWGNDKVDVLAAHGVETHHGESCEGAHGARVVVAGDAVKGVVERAGDVLVGVLRGETRAASEMEEEEEEVGLLISNVQQAFSIMKELKTLHEGFRSSESWD